MEPPKLFDHRIVPGIQFARRSGHTLTARPSTVVGMKVFLDDWRTVPPGWTHADTVAKCVALLATGQVAEVSLDWDLEWTDPDHSGMDVVRFLEDHPHLLPARFRVHTSCPQAAREMLTRLSDVALRNETLASEA